MVTISETSGASPLRGRNPINLSLRGARGILRPFSASLLLGFVVCHLINHSLLLVSLQLANSAHHILIDLWRTDLGTTILVTSALTHYANALWSIYVRHHLRLSRWEWWQLGLGLCIPPLLMLHVGGTRIAERLLNVSSDYDSVLVVLWRVSPSLAIVQAAALLTVWVHASIGMHFWLRTKSWYPAWRGLLAAIGLMIPTLALTGYVSGGNQVLRTARNPSYVNAILENANLTAATRVEISRMAGIGWSIHFGLLVLPFAGRGVRRWVYRLRRPPILTHSSGRKISMIPGATVLETLRANGIPHASVCGGRARCTTCRVLVTKGLASLPEPTGLEAKALARIEAPPDLRLACQIRPTADMSIMPLLAADAEASDGSVRGGLEGSERLITVVFVDLRGSTTLGEARMPYDVLFILNQFFHEMTKALIATNGHYSQFTGDGLMALYGLHARDPATGPAEALRGSREMLARLDQLNRRLGAELPQPLRIGIGIHFAEAIVGTMGPPHSQITTAIGDTVNTAARLEGLTKDYDCPLIVSRRAAEAAGLDLSGRKLHEVAVKGRVQKVEFYALESVP
jgi:adenylate cyclase